jgi:hypothetical protein
VAPDSDDDSDPTRIGPRPEGGAAADDSDVGADRRGVCGHVTSHVPSHGDCVSITMLSKSFGADGSAGSKFGFESARIAAISKRFADSTRNNIGPVSALWGTREPGRQSY